MTTREVISAWRPGRLELPALVTDHSRLVKSRMISWPRCIAITRAGYISFDCYRLLCLRPTSQTARARWQSALLRFAQSMNLARLGQKKLPIINPTDSYCSFLPAIHSILTSLKLVVKTRCSSIKRISIFTFFLNIFEAFVVDQSHGHGRDGEGSSFWPERA